MFSEKQTGFIYKINCNCTGKCYIGSTRKTIATRINEHKSQYKRYLQGKSNFTSSFDIIKHGDYTVEEVEKVEFFYELELLARERNYIKTTENTVNKAIPLRTVKEYYLDNRNTIINRQKEYNKKNAEHITERKKDYYIQNKERILKYQDEYRKKRRINTLGEN